MSRCPTMLACVPLLIAFELSDFLVLWFSIYYTKPVRMTIRYLLVFEELSDDALVLPKRLSNLIDGEEVPCQGSHYTCINLVIVLRNYLTCH